MIRKLFVFALLAVSFISCSGDAGKKGSADEEINAVTEIPLFTIAEFYAEADKYTGKEVQVEGIIDHICRHGGKRLLLVSDDGDLHIDWDERFDEKLEGSLVIVTGIVEEFRVDEGYCLKLEEENIRAHNAGETNPADFESTQHEIQYYRDLMQNEGTDHISYFSLNYITHIEKE